MNKRKRMNKRKLIGKEILPQIDPIDKYGKGKNNRSYRFHSKWKAIKLYPKGTAHRRYARLRLIMSDMSTRPNILSALLLQLHESIDSYCRVMAREVMSITVDTSNLLEDQPLLIGYPSAGGGTSDIPKDTRGFNESIE